MKELFMSFAVLLVLTACSGSGTCGAGGARHDIYS